MDRGGRMVWIAGLAWDLDRSLDVTMTMAGMVVLTLLVS